MRSVPASRPDASSRILAESPSGVSRLRQRNTAADRQKQTPAPTNVFQRTKGRIRKTEAAQTSPPEISSPSVLEKI